MKPSKYDTHHFSDQGSLISIRHPSWLLQFVKCILPAKWWPQCLEYKNEVFVLSKDILGQVKNLNLYKHTYPTKQTSLTLWSICPWTLQVITFDPFNLLSFHVVKIQEKDQRLNFTKKNTKETKHWTKHILYNVDVFWLTMQLPGLRRISHCLHSYPSRHGHISLTSLSPTVTDI